MANNRRHQFDNLSDVGDKLDLDNPTVENIVGILVDIGCLDRVYTFHDDFLGLDDLPQELLSQNVHELDDDTLDKYSDAVSEILYNANEIFYHLEREHSESDLEEIQEERERLDLDND